MIDIHIEKCREDAKLPSYAHDGDAGMDLYAAEDVIIEPGRTALVPVGIKLAIPYGYEVQIRPRSGLTLNDGIVAQLGTIDGDFTGSMGIILINFGEKEFCINNGDRLAQLVISPVVQGNFNQVEQLKETERGEQGFGHTGV